MYFISTGFSISLEGFSEEIVEEIGTRGQVQATEKVPVCVILNEMKWNEES